MELSHKFLEVFLERLPIVKIHISLIVNQDVQTQ